MYNREIANKMLQFQFFLKLFTINHDISRQQIRSFRKSHIFQPTRQVINVLKTIRVSSRRARTKRFALALARADEAAREKERREEANTREKETEKTEGDAMEGYGYK